MWAGTSSRGSMTAHLSEEELPFQKSTHFLRFGIGRPTSRFPPMPVGVPPPGAVENKPNPQRKKKERGGSRRLGENGPPVEKRTAYQDGPSYSNTHQHHTPRAPDHTASTPFVMLSTEATCSRHSPTRWCLHPLAHEWGLVRVVEEGWC
jgi:hypothetical protein